MNFAIDRRLRTKDIEWFIFMNHHEKLYACLILNDKDRSRDCSEYPELERLHEIDEAVGDEYMKTHLFIESKELYDRFGDEIRKFYDGFAHNLNIDTWICVHVVKDAHRAAEKYLIDWGVDKDKWAMREGNPAYDHLSQDWAECSCGKGNGNSFKVKKRNSRQKGR